MQGKIADLYASLNAARAYVIRWRAPVMRAPRCAAMRGLHSVCRRARHASGAGRSGSRWQRLHQRLPGRAAAARCQALRDRRRHPGDPPHAHRPGAVRGGLVSRRVRADPDGARLPQGGGGHRRAHPQPALREGARLPAEIELARQFGVNRSTVREALRELEPWPARAPAGLKLLSVSRPHQASVAAGVSDALLLHDVTAHDVWQALTILEPPIAVAAAPVRPRIWSRSRRPPAPSPAPPTLRRRCTAPPRCCAASAQRPTARCCASRRAAAVAARAPLRVMIDKVPRRAPASSAPMSTCLTRSRARMRRAHTPG